MDWVYAVLLAGAVAVLLAAEWPRVIARLGRDERAPAAPRAPRRRRASHLRVVEDDESDEFAASVQRDLERLPTIDERDR